MTEVICPGLPADWVNAWLAAVGATRLEPRLRLRWTVDSVSRAVLCADDADPVHLLSDAWPTRREVLGLSIARTWGDTPTVARKVPIRDFVARTRATRALLSSWTISSTMTDLDVDGKGEVAHARFDPPAPKGLTMHDRLLAVYDRVTPTIERLAESLDGKAARVQNNGLGFDITRLASQADTSVRMVDPVMEVLAFLGLALLPVRGTGTDRRINKRVRSSVKQRGWHRVALANGETEHSFLWPAWTQLLDFDGIDALLDIWNWKKPSSWEGVGIRRGWRTVRYRPKGAESTRGYGSERL